ncbi:alpha/beta hydrolase [[Kitasatospora] papulosa]|uniref:alpha/beta hydrolase n=1 Tax=[Kitasatospora] papulosa TaxID=1464011 RepID=UPI0035DE31A6
MRVRDGRAGRCAAPALAVLLVTALLAGCDGGPASPGSSKGSSQAPERSSDASGALDWKRCAAPEDGTAPGPAWRCATLDVPLDHARPDGRTIGIALIRKAATRKSARIGSMLFNFGGPGGSGVDTLPRAASAYRELNTRYDLVGFDPRGVAASSGVRCRDDAGQETAYRRIDMTPDTPAEEAAFIADGQDFGAGCARLSGPVLPHVGTSNAARDMDAIRRALGDDTLAYFGISYGTELGGTYAHLFPEKVGRIVLDAVVDPTADSVGHARNQARGFQRALENYLKDRGEDPAAGTRRITTLLERLDEEPLPTASGRELNESLAVIGIVTPLYSRSAWPTLTAALDEAENSGRGDRLLALADSYNGRDEDGHYSTRSHSQRAISCADAKARPTAAEARALLPEFRELSPIFGPFLAWDTAGWCAGWPVEGEHDTPEASAPGAAPILVIGTTGDPATPYEGARRMADELGEGVGVTVTNRGEGHGSYGESDCVTSLVDAYFLDGKVPADGRVCS